MTSNSEARQVIYPPPPPGDIEDIPTNIDEILLRFAVKYYEGLGLTLESRMMQGVQIRDEASRIITLNTSYPNPSPFKRVAAFTIAFSRQAPLAQTLRGANGGIPSQILDIPNHQNIMLAVVLSMLALHGAEIEHPDRGILTLENRIKMSRHFLTDLVHIISCDRSASGTGERFHWLSLTYEGLAYKCNRGVEDPV